MKTLSSIIRRHAAERPGAPALVQGDTVLTYGDLHARSNRVASALAAAGVGPGGRVAFLAKNCLEYFELLFGAAKLNAVVVPVNWRLTPGEVGFIVEDAGATVFAFGAEQAGLVAELADRLGAVKAFVSIGGDGGKFTPYAAWRDAGADADPGVEAAGGDVAFHIYSSGTTGDPKGVLLSNDNLFSLLPVSSKRWGVSASSVNMVVLPLFHIGGCGWALVGLSQGSKSVVVRDADPAGLIGLIGEHKITHAFLAPVVLQFMQAVPEASSGDFSSLELIVYGASPISEPVLAGALQLFKCAFAQAYGLTETTGAIVTLPPEDHDLHGPSRHRLRSAGKPHEGVEMKIVSPETGTELGPGSPGEIWTRSRQNMLGYWQRDADSAAAFTADGWLKTGDVGYFDDEGYLYIHDRLKDMIISGGENIYPAEIENVLAKCEGVADVAVIGIPSEKWGESPLAVVVPAAGATVDARELLAFARRHLAGYKVPVDVVVRAALPRTPSGKVLKKELRAPYWQGRDRPIG
jgi:long-chain acyl-CoA synthetase